MAWSKSKNVCVWYKNDPNPEKINLMRGLLIKKNDARPWSLNCEILQATSSCLNKKMSLLEIDKKNWFKTSETRF